MDFVHDTLADGCQCRIVTLVDDWPRNIPILRVVVRMNDTTGGDAVGAGVEACCNTVSSTCNRRADVTLRLHAGRVCTRGVHIDHTQPVKPTDDTYLHAFNGRLRGKCTNVTDCADIAHAQQVIAASRTDYNEARLLRALVHLASKEVAESRQQLNPKEAEYLFSYCVFSGPK